MTNTKNDVIRVAGRLFAERGYHATSMRDLGKELGLLGSSLYAHIASKEELLVAVVEDGARLFETAAASLAGDTPPERLHSLISAHLTVLLDNPNQVRTFLSESRALDPVHRERIISSRDKYEASLRSILTEGAADGSFRADLDPKLDTIFILSVLNGVERWYKPDGSLDRDGLTEAVYEFVMRSICSPHR